MDVSFSPEAAALWRELSDLEQMRVELAVRRMSLNQLRGVGGDFIVETYDLEICGHVAAGGYPVVVRSLKRNASTRSRPSTHGR